MRILIAVMAAVALGLSGCGGSDSADSSPPTSSTPVPSSPPAVTPEWIESVAWPTDLERAREMADSLPDSLDGVASEGVQVDDMNTPPSVSVEYPDGSLTPPMLRVAAPDPDGSPLRNLAGLLGYFGCFDYCPDLQASPSILSALDSISSELERCGGSEDAVGCDGYLLDEAPSSEFLWASFTSTYDVESDESIPPDERSNCIMWQTADAWFYLVCGRSEEQRDRLVTAAASGAQDLGSS